MIDGAHAPGQIDLDLDALGVDFYGGNCHKWLCAPKGSGFLFARPERQAMLEPLIISWGYEADVPGPRSSWIITSARGTHDPSAYLSVPAAIAFQREHDWPRVRAACHLLAREARKGDRRPERHAAIAPDSADWWGQMCTCPVLPTDAMRLNDRLVGRVRGSRFPFRPATARPQCASRFRRTTARRTCTVPARRPHHPLSLLPAP